MSVKQLIEVICEGPRCKRGEGEQPKRLTWDPELAKTDPLAVPDDAWRLRTLQLFNGEAHVFCCTRCNHDYDLDHSAPLQSPREKAMQMAAEQVVREKQLAEAAAKRAETDPQTVNPAVTSPGPFASEPQIELPKLEA